MKSFSIVGSKRNIIIRTWVFKKFSLFGLEEFTIMGKTAGLTVVPKTIIDWVNKLGRTQIVTTIEPGCPQCCLKAHEGTVEWKSVEENGVQPEGGMQSVEDGHKGLFRNVGNFIRSGLRLELLLQEKWHMGGCCTSACRLQMLNFSRQAAPYEQAMPEAPELG